nr:hypothetical protein [Tanacetum cinerariifolium]
MPIATTLVVTTTNEVMVMVINLIGHPPKTQCMTLAIVVKINKARGAKDTLVKIAQKRTTRSSSATTTTTITSVTDAQLKALNDQGVANALATRDADRNRNGEDSHDSGMGGRMFPKESNKSERYIGGLPDMIYGSVMAFKPKTMQDVIEFTTELMDKKISTFAECQTKNKKKQDDNHNKKTRGRTVAGPTLLDLRKRSHIGDLSYCVLNATITMMRNLTCYECGNQGHYKSECPELKNQKHENQAEDLYSAATRFGGCYILVSRVKKIAQKRTTRSSSATTTTTITSVTNAQLKALNDQGVANALETRDADRNRNGEDSHDSGMGGRRQAPPARECTYQDFMKCKPIYFKGTEGVVELT